MKLYLDAKGNLDKYNIERKQVDLDATEGKKVLEMYLKYKKAFIEASTDPDSSTESREVQHYKTLSTQYLSSYHELQAKLQQSYSDATKFQAEYSSLSKQYQDASSKSNKIAGQVDKVANLVASTRSHLNTVKNVQLKKVVEDLSNQTTSLATKEGLLSEAKTRKKTIDNRVGDSEANYFKLAAISFRLNELADAAHAKAERNEMRYLNFVRDTQKAASDIEATTKKAMLLKKKYQAANATGLIYAKSYKAGKCEREKEPNASPLLEDALTLLSVSSSDGDIKDSSPAECKSDKRMATQNLQAAHTAKTEHRDELTYLAHLRQAHAQADDGAQTAKAVQVGSAAKGHRLSKIATTAKEMAATPCA